MWSTAVPANADVRTLGIDLASQDKHTASCLVSWNGGRAQVEQIHVGRSNRELVEEIEAADWTGIDAPFGWPDAFIDAVESYRDTGLWPASEGEWPEQVRRLRYRATDAFVAKQARAPLSVSSDRIAVTAARCASLLTDLARDSRPRDRLGADRVVEVYPAASLVVWGFNVKGYKGTAPAVRDTRRRLLDELMRRGEGWLSASEDIVDWCIARIYRGTRTLSARCRPSRRSTRSGATRAAERRRCRRRRGSPADRRATRHIRRAWTPAGRPPARCGRRSPATRP